MRRLGLLTALLVAFAPPCVQAQAHVLTLERALELTRENHPKLTRERAAVAHARARAQGAWSRYLPGVTAEFSYAPETPNYVPSPAFRRVLDRRGEGGVDRVVNTDGEEIRVACARGSSANACDERATNPLPSRSYELYDFWTARVGIAWTLFDWGATVHATRAAKAIVHAREEGLQATLAEVVLETKLAYYDVLAAEAAFAVAGDEIAARQRNLESTRALQKAGRNTGVDVASAESALAAAELLLVRTQGGVAFARAVLATLVGDESVRERPLAVPAQASSESLPTEQELARSARERPEVHEVSWEAKAMRELSESARGAYLPALSLEAGPTWSGSKLNELIPNFGAVVAIKYPGSQGMNPFAVAASVKEAAAQSASLAAQREVLHDEVRLQAESARIDLVTARHALVAAQKAVQTARKRRDQAELRYRQGVGTFLELSEAELALTAARFDEVRATFDIGRAQSKLERALGTR